LQGNVKILKQRLLKRLYNNKEHCTILSIKSFKCSLNGNDFKLYVGAYTTEIKQLSFNGKSFALTDTIQNVCSSFKPGISTIELNPEYQYLFLGGYDGIIKIYSMLSKKIEKNLIFHTKGINQLKFQFNFLFSASNDNTIAIWKVGLM